MRRGVQLKSWWATGAPRALGSVLGAVLGLALNGCGMVTAVTSPVAAPAPEAVLGTSGAQPGREVPPGVARTLAVAPPGGSLSYQLADGRPASFTLGAIFESGRGV